MRVSEVEAAWMDLKNPRAMYAKAILFVLIGLLCLGLALAEDGLGKPLDAIFA